MDFALPQIGEGVYEAELVRWLVGPGDAVKPGQSLMEVMTDKATMEVPAPFAGVVVSLAAEAGGPIKVGQHVLTYTPAGADEPAAPRPEPVAAAKAKPSNGHHAARPAAAPPPAAPSVRMLARKLGVDLAGLTGTGPGGRILVDDVTTAYEAARPRPAAAEAKPAAKKAGGDLDLGRPGTRVRLAGLRKRIAERMVESARTIPHATYVDECDVTELVRLRQSLREPLERRGVKLTYLPFVVKAVALALKEVPLVNASLDESAGELVLHDRYHVGVAVAAPAGLVVPVVKDADRKDVAAIASEIERLSADARAGRSKLDDLKGGTFTVTSIGGFGGLFSTPIINPPEAAILGVGKVVRRPVFDDAGRVVPADLVYLSLSFDHRIIDGAAAAVFANAVARLLRNPAALLLP